MDARQFKEILDRVGDGVYFVDKDRRVSYWNEAAERLTGFAAGEVVGRRCSENILTHVDGQGCLLCTGDCPLAHTLEDGQERGAVVYLHHKLGHRVPVHISVSPLVDGGKTVGAVETFRECSDVIAMRGMIEHLKKLGCIDVATGLVNRRVVEGRLTERVQEFGRFGWPLGVLMIEVDLLNDLEQAFGATGRADGLRMAAMSVQNALRSLDTAGRWDQSTILVVVANVTASELVGIAERVRVMVDMAYRNTEQGQLHVTVSIGAAGADEKDNARSIVQKASRCLYESRSRGRNRVTVFGVGTVGDEEIKN